MHTSSLLAFTVTMALLAVPTSAFAEDFSLKQEPGVSIPLTDPQSQLYGVGGTESLKLLFGITPWLDAGPGASFMLLPASVQGDESGVAWGFGGGLRIKRPHDAESFYGISPWIDADALYVRTGVLNRPGFDAAAGVSAPIGEARNFWVGPFVRFLDVIQTPDRAGFDNSNAKVLTLGISFELGSGVEQKRRPEAAALPPQIQIVTREVAVPCPVCPECPPVYAKVIIKPDRLELKEKIQFTWNQTVLDQASFPVLDEVAKALRDHPDFKVQVDGYTSSEGGDEHNQVLSEGRAAAVVDYLAAHGVEKSRLVSKGFASSVPIATNTTEAGREANRRVEFIVSFIIIDRSK